MYLITACGVDIGSTSGAVATTRLRQTTWEREAVEAEPYTAVGGTFDNQIRCAYNILEYIKRTKPDIVGIEDLKTRGGRAFARAQLGSPAAGILHGIVRTLLWQTGIPFLDIHVMRYKSFVEHTPYMVGTDKNRKDYKWSKEEVFDWLRQVYGIGKENLVGNKKEKEDCADALVDASIAACFFSAYWLKELPPLNRNQMNTFYTSKGDKKGFMDIPDRYLWRNSDKEPEWQALRNL